MKQSFVRAFGAALVACGIGLALGAAAQPAAKPGVFVVGVDGVDPVIADRLMAEGRLPNLAQLARDGSYQRLGTSNPPQSPVAWSSFVTGMDPGGHGIFDFVHRDPKTYHPISSATPPPGDPGSSVELFGFVIPLSVPDLPNNRGGTPWWDLLVEHGVDVEVYRIPGNFPAPPSDAKVLAGMGTVDIRGGFGTYTLYTDTPLDTPRPKGDIELVALQDLDLDGRPDTATGVLRGPPDQFRLPPGKIPTKNEYVKRGVTIHLGDGESVAIEVDGQVVVLRQGEWSEWIEVGFDALPYGLSTVHGTVRFYARELHPRLQIYASPVNLSPASPPMPITTPDSFVSDLFEALGFFYTKGLSEETDALKDGAFDDADYVKQVGLVQEDTNRMIDLALARFEPGDATFVYLSDVDLQSHMLWRHGDPKDLGAPPHPAFEAAAAERHADDIARFYTDVDRSVGAIRSRLPADTLLIVMSDHGFQTYTRKLHLNAWLRNEGYLVMKDGKQTGQIVQDAVDWSLTRAYGLGFNGLYLNLRGREGQGVVDPAEAPALLDEIAKSLTAYRDPANGEQVVLRADRSDMVYSEARRAEGPDLVVGYNRGYGCSDESTLGEITEGVIEDNRSRWSGNHLMAPEIVPGVLFVNRRLPGSGHDLTDLTATILSHYGVEPAPGMTGEPML